ncbi:hypothetical protein HDU87_000672 [Geranomyces variabilis]|uniref:AB hydrolase-1 domain-containing protein n=1 Tax=Geranomyces variabilis TaxID=109894 RepID=A0AAD5XM73_9FUNG|nr:hypothetical protein HDU87_000672 [Geranomyces variabilis]
MRWQRPAFTPGTLPGSDPGISLAFNAYPAPTAAATPATTVILCAHALGMTKETFEPIIAALWANPAVARAVAAIYAFDARQQGASARLNVGRIPTDLTVHTDWKTNALDLLCLANHIHHTHDTENTITRIVGLGHSYGAVALTTAAVIHAARFAALLLCEPVLFTPEFFVQLTGNPAPFGDHMRQAAFVQTATRKKGIFANRDAAAREMRRKAFYAGFADESFELWLDHGFEEIELADDGNKQRQRVYALRCTPMTEASVFLGTGCTHPTFARLSELDIPTVVLTGSQSEWAAPIFAADGETGLVRDVVIANKVKRGKHYYVENASHMVAVEQPQAVANHMIELLASLPPLEAEAGARTHPQGHLPQHLVQSKL